MTVTSYTHALVRVSARMHTCAHEPETSGDILHPIMHLIQHSSQYAYWNRPYTWSSTLVLKSGVAMLVPLTQALKAGPVIAILYMFINPPVYIWVDYSCNMGIDHLAINNLHNIICPEIIYSKLYIFLLCIKKNSKCFCSSVVVFEMNPLLWFLCRSVLPRVNGVHGPAKCHRLRWTPTRWQHLI
jgi:hypothetical protein